MTSLPETVTNEAEWEELLLWMTSRGGGRGGPELADWAMTRLLPQIQFTSSDGEGKNESVSWTKGAFVDQRNFFACVMALIYNICKNQKQSKLNKAELLSLGKRIGRARIIQIPVKGEEERRVSLEKKIRENLIWLETIQLSELVSEA